MKSKNEVLAEVLPCPKQFLAAADPDLVVAAAAGVVRPLPLESRGLCRRRKDLPILARVNVLAKFGQRFGQSLTKSNPILLSWDRIG